MAIFGKKKEEPIVVQSTSENPEAEDVRLMQQTLFAREEVKIYLACEEGKKLFDLAMKLNKEQK